MARETTIAIRYESLLVLRAQSSHREWCPACAAEAEILHLDSGCVVSDEAKPDLEHWLQSGQLHASPMPDGSLQVCLPSLLACAARQKSQPTAALRDVAQGEVMNRKSTSLFAASFARLARLARRTFTLTLAIALLAACASAAPLVYVVTSNQQFGTVDVATGAFTQIGPYTPEGQANLVWAADGSLLSLTYSGNLERINPATGETTVIGPTGLGFNAFDLAEVRGKLFVTDFSNNLYSVNPATGAATLVRGSVIPSDPNPPFSFNPDGTINLCDETFYGFGGALYATFDAFTQDPNTLATTTTVAPALYRIDPATGAATFIANTDFNLGATVVVDGRFFAFKWLILGFLQPQSQLSILNLSTGQTTAGPIVDASAGGVTGAAPVRSPIGAQ